LGYGLIYIYPYLLDRLVEVQRKERMRAALDQVAAAACWMWAANPTSAATMQMQSKL
jgi:hypothetical protein